MVARTDFSMHDFTLFSVQRACGFLLGLVCKFTGMIQRVVDTKPYATGPSQLLPTSQVPTGSAATLELVSSISTHGSGSESTSEDGSQLTLFSLFFFRVSSGFSGARSHLHMPSLRLSRRGIECETRYGGPAESMPMARCWDVSVVESMLFLVW